VGFIYITSVSVREQVRFGGTLPDSGTATAAATIITNMKAQTIGRALGIGLRVAGRVAGQHIATASAAPGSQTVGSKPERVQVAEPIASKAIGAATGNVARGVGGFLRPFRRLGGILWLEMTGAFFFLFVVAASLSMWRTKPSHLNGPYDKNFLAAAVIMVVFFYLGASSFWRARKR